MNIVFLGAPGSGKGTQSLRVENYYHIVHISTGDIFREAIANKTEMGVLAKSFIDKGHLVPDDVTIGIVKERISKEDCMNGFIMDGFPRTLTQALEYDKITKNTSFAIDKVVYLNVDESKLLDRIVNRRVCPKCGASYNIKSYPPKKEGICDECGNDLIIRKDDNEESVKERLKSYNDQTLPLVEYYKQKGILIEVDAFKDIDEIFESIIKSLGAN